MHNSDMCFQITWTTKAFATHLTHIFPALWPPMHAPSVRNHVSEAVEDHFTLRAWVLNLLGVDCIDVDSHGPRIREGLPTYLAHYLILAYLEMHTLYMLPEVAWADKALITYITQEFTRLIPLVHSAEVVLHVALLVEGLLTLRALINLDLLMDGLYVHLETCGAGELLATKLAYKLLSLHAHVYHQAVLPQLHERVKDLVALCARVVDLLLMSLSQVRLDVLKFWPQVSAVTSSSCMMELSLGGYRPIYFAAQAC